MGVLRAGRRTWKPVEEGDDRAREGVVAVACDHVCRAGDVDELHAREPGQELSALISLTRSLTRPRTSMTGTAATIGANLARAEMKVTFEALLPHLLGSELLAPPRCLRSNLINGIKKMPVRLGP